MKVSEINIEGRIEIQELESELCLRLSGNFCFHLFRDFFPLIPSLTASTKDLIVDVSRVLRIDSAGIGMILVLEDEIRRTGRQLRLRGPSPDLMLLIKTAALGQRLHCTGSETRPAKSCA